MQPGSCRLLLTVGDDPTAHVYEAASGRQVGEGSACCGRMLPTALQQAAAVSSHVFCLDGPAIWCVLQLCALQSIQALHSCRLQVAQLKGHLDYSFAAAWHPDGNVVATGNQVCVQHGVLVSLRFPCKAVSVPNVGVLCGLAPRRQRDRNRQPGVFLMCSRIRRSSSLHVVYSSVITIHPQACIGPHLPLLI
jgi:hypothetical protein